MQTEKNPPLNRRTFFTTSAAAGLTAFGLVPAPTAAKPTSLAESIHIIGPKEGFSPQVGTLLSMLTWMRMVVLASVSNLKKADLDYLHDENSNTIGAMLLHLAATERIYQGLTFEDDSAAYEDANVDWDAAMHLGDEGRKIIVGKELSFYVDVLTKTRAKTIEEFRKRDDFWLSKVDESFFENKPTNNYCKWFHVCEHESNHNGQIKWIKSRLPGGVSGND